MNIRGSIVAIVTPMQRDGSVDWTALATLIDWHIESGTHGIVSVGTTGESATLSQDEHFEVIRATNERVAGRIPVIAGTGSNSTAEAIIYTKKAKEFGVDASLQVVPYYNNPSQEGLYQHFKTIAQAVDLPIILYNVPSRTVVNLSNETVLRLSKIDNIIGIKDATGDLEKGIELINATSDDFFVLSGNDSSALELIEHGALGDVSVTANIAPALMSKMCSLALSGNFSAAKKINDQLVLLHDEIFTEPSPAAAKWALEQMGHIKNALRLPMLPLTTAGQERLQPLLKEINAI